jgi:hypothetical protein
MSKLILDHAQKYVIDSILSLPLSYRQKAEKLQKEHDIKISFKTLQKYHVDFLGGAVAADDDDAPDDDAPDEVLVIDFEAADALEAELINIIKPSFHSVRSLANIIDSELAGLFALQMVLTKAALKRHCLGGGRYPAEYVRHLQIITALVRK